MAAEMTVTERPLHPLFGVELAGLELSGGVSPEALARLLGLFSAGRG